MTADDLHQPQGEQATPGQVLGFEVAAAAEGWAWGRAEEGAHTGEGGGTRLPCCVQ